MGIVYDVLPCEYEKRLSKTELCDLLGVKWNSCREMIERERQIEQLPILSDTIHGGYWKSESAVENEKFAASMKARALSDLRSARAAAEKARKLRAAENGEQFALDEWRVF